MTGKPPLPSVPAGHSYAGSYGAVALAAYEPDETMFARQLLSIQAQTHKEFVCLISADGNYGRVQDIVKRTCGDDDRFRVLGYDTRVGFHQNFERALEAVPSEARWVALSDQDDYWYPQKLTKLLPYLDDAALVTCQARVVSPETSMADPDPSQGRLTDRKNVGAADLFANNQVTGSLCAFRREVLELALPFPSLAAPSQYHDHWLALCAVAGDGVRIEDLVLQDYIQHGGNVVGESSQSLLGSVRNTYRFVRRYEGNASARSICRIIYKTGLGWRTLMARTLLQRLGSAVQPAPTDLQCALEAYANPKTMRLVRLLAGGWRRRNIPVMRVLEILLGIAAKPFSGRDILS